MKNQALPAPDRLCARLLTWTLFFLLGFSSGPFAISAPVTADPIRALMITGGGWHDYAAQKDILAEGIQARANVEWTVVMEGMEGSTEERGRHMVDLLQEPGWGDDYDVVVYNICFSKVTDAAFIEGITRVHEEGLAAVVLHCALHSFREAKTDAWHNLLGLESFRHEGQRPFAVENIAPEHPVMKQADDSWQTPQGELYVIEELHPTATPLARSYGVDTEAYHVTVWTNRYGKGRVFGTSIGHHNETMAADTYLDFVTRGLLWTVGKLDDNGSPAPGFAATQEKEDKHLVLVAGRPSHSEGTHEHNAAVQLMQDCLQSVPGLEVTVHLNGWPSDPNALESADGILLYMDGGGNHPAIQKDRLRKIEELMMDGVGLAVFHYATEVPKQHGGAQFLQWVGGYYETHYSVNPVWKAAFNALPDHPITRGVRPFSVRDEWYFSIRFRPGLRGITPILQAVPSDQTRDGPYVAPKGPYQHIIEAKGGVETVAWAVERDDGGRGFGFTGGHFHENWGDDNFRKIALNALVWLTGAEVPPGGVSSSVTKDQLQKNLD